MSTLRARLAVYLPLLILALTAVWRLIVLASSTVTFHSDEAIVGLMASHINQGKAIPVFFYGQPYMGSLDPLLIAGMFRLTGDSVLGIRLVQALVYLGFVGTLMLLARRLSSDRWTTAVVGLLAALPPLMVTLYTTISLGGYGEILILGNLLLLVGTDLITCDGLSQQALWVRWLAFGILFGLGWWTNNLIVAYALPVVIGLLIKRRLPWPKIAGALVMALIFSAPWWIYNAQHDWESVRFLLGGFKDVPGTPHATLPDKIFNFLVVGLPALSGTRYPWTFPLIVPTIGVALLFLAILTGPRLAPVRKPQVTRLLWIMIAGFTVIDLLSSFGMDPTGRYLLPLFIPLTILVAMNLNALRRRFRWVVIAVPILIAVNLAVTISAMGGSRGLTSQWDPASDIANSSDQAVIDFLNSHYIRYGYSTYWASYRLDFLSHEAVILTPELPWRASLYYVQSDERYLPYKTLVDQADSPALLTANLPNLDTIIAERLDAAGIHYSRQALGPYTVFYDLSRKVNPADLGLQSLGPTQ